MIGQLSAASRARSVAVPMPCHALGIAPGSSATRVRSTLTRSTPSPSFLAPQGTHTRQLRQRTVVAVQAAEGAEGIDDEEEEEEEEKFITDASSRECAIAIAEALSGTKCSDISVLHVEPLVSWTSYMVFATVFSKPQLLAALDRVEKAAVEAHERVQQNQPGSSPWECLDFGDVVVHVMTNEQRDYYDIESFYATAAEVDLPFAIDTFEEEDRPPHWTTSTSGL